MSDETKTIPSAGRLKRRTKSVSEQPITDEERAELDDPRLAKPKTTARLGMSIAAAPPLRAAGTATPRRDLESSGSAPSASPPEVSGPSPTTVIESTTTNVAGKTPGEAEAVTKTTASRPKRTLDKKSSAATSTTTSTEKVYRRVGFTLNADARQKLVDESNDYGSNVAVVIAKVIDAHESGRVQEIYARYLPSSKTNAQVAALLPSSIRLPRQSQAGKPRLQIKLLESTLEALEEMMGRPELSFASRLTAIIEDAYDENRTVAS